MSDAVLSSIDTRPLIDRSSDPNLEVLRWFWRVGPNPFAGPIRTFICAAPFSMRFVRVLSPVTVYDSTKEDTP